MVSLRSLPLLALVCSLPLLAASDSTAEDFYFRQKLTVPGGSSAAISLGGASFPVAKVGKPWTFDFKTVATVSGLLGVSPGDLTWTRNPAGTPAWMNLGASGGIAAGTPATQGSVTFDVIARHGETTGQRTYTLTVLPAPLQATTVATGDWWSCALLPTTEAKCWGQGNYGQLGHGSGTGSVTPVYVRNPSGTGNLSGVVELDAGLKHACARLGSGEAVCWGDDIKGQKGNGPAWGSTTYVRNANNTLNLTGIVQISTGGEHACALLSDTTVKCWGANGNGQVGDGSQTDRQLPVSVRNGDNTADLTGVAAISAGGLHTCAQMLDGSVKCWGNNGHGRLGDNTTVQKLLPVDVVGEGGTGRLTSIAQIDTGAAHTCAVATAGAILCWGEATAIGSSTGSVLRPWAKPDISGASFVLAGRFHTCAIVSGAAKCWGSGTAGQLGDGTAITSRAVRDVVGLSSGVSHMAGGEAHTCAVHDGEAMCWGLNNSGQVGDGTSGGSYTAPVSATGG